MKRHAKRILVTGVAVAVAGLALGPAASQDRGLAPFSLPLLQGLDPRSICGSQDDLQDVERYTGNLGVSQDYVLANLGSTVQLHWLTDRAIGKAGYIPGNVGGRPWCTGTLISDSLVLTAGHCFEPQNGSATDYSTPFTRDANGIATLAPADQLAKLQTVRVGFQINAETGVPRSPKIFPVKAVIERVFDPKGIDYAIIEVSATADGRLPGDFATPAKIAERAALPGERLAIIQHPGGLPKMIAAGTATANREPFLFYDDIDTLGASSGAGVRDEHGDLVGVHIRGGCDTVGNSAVSMTAIKGVSDAL